MFDLADGHLGSLMEHLLRDADGTGHIAAVAVDLRHELLGHRRSAVQHNREAGQTAADLLKDIEPQLGLGARLELIGAVAGADGDGQRVDTGAGDELLHLLRAGEEGVVRLDMDIVLDAGQCAELPFHDDAVGVGVTPPPGG